MESRSDAQLVARCRAGDQVAWHELVDRYARYVHAIVVQGFGLRGQDAEDAFQDVFTRVWERLGTLRDPDALRPWLAQLTRRTCLDRLRQAGHDVPLEDADGVADEDTIARIDEALAVHEALAALAPDCREILDRFFCRDESYRTIGEALGLPGGTVASRISRCLTRLRDAYEGRKPAATASGGKVDR